MTSQAQLVRDIILDGQWHHYEEISQLTGASIMSVYVEKSRLYKLGRAKFESKPLIDGYKAFRCTLPPGPAYNPQRQGRTPGTTKERKYKKAKLLPTVGETVLVTGVFVEDDSTFVSVRSGRCSWEFVVPEYRQA